MRMSKRQDGGVTCQSPAPPCDLHAEARQSRSATMSAASLRAEHVLARADVARESALRAG